MFVLVDAATNYIDAYWVPGPSTNAVIRCLGRAFATHGLCDVIVSDNAQCFQSAEYAAFLEGLGIKKMHSAPYFPQANGVAEKAVGTVMAILRKLTGDDEERLTAALAAHRSTPGADGRSPAKRLLNRTPLTLLHKLNSAGGRQPRLHRGRRAPVRGRRYIVGPAV